MSFERSFADACRRFVGSPYIWAGKGDYAVRGGQVVPMQQLGAPLGFDCSGLMAYALKSINGPDLRAAWNADAIRRNLPEPGGTETLWLVVYGSAGHADHVALELGDSGITIEAAGGDGTTLDVAAAKASPYLPGGARVVLGPETHRNRIGRRSLLAYLSAPVVPPA